MIVAGTGEAVPIHIVCQNAGVIVSRHKDHVYVESFELSPLNSAVMKSSGRLRRNFPETAITMDLETFRDHFQRTFASVLHKLSHQQSPDICPRVKKAG